MKDTQPALMIAKDLSLPLEVVTEKLAFLGRTGSGKTYGALKLAELMLGAGAQIGAIDPVGVWRALRVPAPGGQAFEVVVFGGLYGDLPLEPSAGELVADLVTDRGLSFVLDVSQFIPSEQQRFVKAFADRFFHRRKAKPAAVHLFLEECQEFLPENPSGLEAQTLGVMQRLWKLGRNFGIGGSLISQRPQEIAKKALNMSGTLFAFQMTGPQERKAVRAWVAEHNVAIDIERVLQKLTVGEPHVESPGFLEVSRTVRILPRVTADLSSTPKVIGAKVAVQRLTPIDVEQLKASMAATIEKAKADDPRELRKQIAELRAALAKKQPAVDLKQSAVERPKPALTDHDREILTKLSDRIAALREHLVGHDQRLVEQIRTATASAINTATSDTLTLLHRSTDDLVRRLGGIGVERVLGKLAQIHPTTAQRPDEQRPSPHARRVAPAVAQATSSRPARVVPPSNGHPAPLSGMQAAMLTALAQHPDGLTKKKILIHTGYASSGPVSRAFATLVREGWAEPVGTATLRITPVGLTQLGPFDPLPLGDALRESLLSGTKLSTMERALLKAICGAHPDPIRKGEVLERTGYASSGPVSAAFGKLVGLGYVRSEGPALVRATDELFG